MFFCNCVSYIPIEAKLKYDVKYMYQLACYMNATQTAAEIQAKVMAGLVITEHKNNSFILDVGMEKEQKQEIGWKVSVLPIPHCESLGRAQRSPTWMVHLGFFIYYILLLYYYRRTTDRSNFALAAHCA